MHIDIGPQFDFEPEYAVRDMEDMWIPRISFDGSNVWTGDSSYADYEDALKAACQHLIHMMRKMLRE